jgi:hypothetical protein
MEIIFLNQLKDNPSAYPNKEDYKGTIEAISVQEIESLEQLYNKGTTFPKALRELLFLAGNYCYVLDTGWYDTQQELQEASRKKLLKYDKDITRPFFVIDIYNASEQFLYVYLDEGDNPFVYQAYLPTRNDIIPFSSLNKRLSEYIDSLIERVKQGYNPF